MDVKTYRAKTMHEALALVRNELGPQASVLHTREVRGGGLLRWLYPARQIEVTASTTFSVPSRLAPPSAVLERGASKLHAPDSSQVAGLDLEQFAQQQKSGDATGVPFEMQSPLANLGEHASRSLKRALPESLFQLFTELIDAEISEATARDLVERVHSQLRSDELCDIHAARLHVARLLENDFAVTGPIRLREGQRHLVALVGPTGVGKTTTIAKLAANYRLKQKHRVGLITVDTYRIAAVEQLRTYADIIDLPMEVVATPRDMRQAVARMADLDLILMDTAGRSPRDEVKIQELRSLLCEAQPDEVHLVLSSVASAESLAKTAERFAAVGTTALLITKLDEASGLGNLLPLVRKSRLPLSYVTNGQNVPDDIEAADSQRMARLVLGLDKSIRKPLLSHA